MLGAVLATDFDRHIKVDIAATLLPRVAALLQRPFQFLAAGVCGLLSNAAWHFWREEWAYAAPGEAWIAALEIILPVGFALLALHFLLLGLGPSHVHPAQPPP